MPKKARTQIKLLYFLTLNFLLILGVFFVPAIQNVFIGPLLFLSPFISLSIVGLLLTISVKRSRLRRVERKYLLLTGISAAGIFPCTVLHNLIYGLGIFLFNKGFEEPIFFLLGVLVLPIIFIFSAIKSILLLRKTKQV